MITLEDILEQIVGDISDEYDKEDEANYEVVSDKETIVFPKMTLEEFNRLFKRASNPRTTIRSAVSLSTVSVTSRKRAKR